MDSRPSLRLKGLSTRHTAARPAVGPYVVQICHPRCWQQILGCNTNGGGGPIGAGGVPVLRDSRPLFRVVGGPLIVAGGLQLLLRGGGGAFW